MLAALLPDPLQLELVQVVDVDGQLPAHVVEQHPRHLATHAGCGTGQGRVGRCPEVFGLAHFVEHRVADLQQAALLQVRGGHAPAPAQVAVEAVAKYLSQGLLGIAQGLEAHLRVWLPGVQLNRQVQGRRHPLAQLVVPQPFRPGGRHRAVEGGAQLPDLHEVVEVAGLQRGILAIVGEAEQLAGGVLEIGVPAQAAHGEEAGDRW